MSREIRKVPPNWEHPRYTADDAHRQDLIGELRPCHDQDYETAAAEWIEAFNLWKAGQHEDQQKEWASHYQFYWEYESPPDEARCRPAFDAEPTWYCMYETVSEGTPCTPAFETKQELADWLVEKGENHGTQWEQRYSREAAQAFIEQEWAPTMTYDPERGIRSGPEALVP